MSGVRDEEMDRRVASVAREYSFPIVPTSSSKNSTISDKSGVSSTDGSMWGIGSRDSKSCSEGTAML